MSEVKDLNQRLNELTQQIETQPQNIDLFIERGKLNHRMGNFGAAMNDFLVVQVIDPENKVAEEFIDFINEILNFRNLDLYNP